MPSDERKRIALDAVRPRIDLFHAAVAVAADQVRGLLAGSGGASDDQSVALGHFAQGKVDIERFASFAPRSPRIDTVAEAPVRAAHSVLTSMLAQGNDLFILKTEEGKGLAWQVGNRLALIGRAFGAARVIELAKRCEYKEDKHAAMLEDFPFERWNSSERAMAPALVVELPGTDFMPSVVVPYLDASIKIVFVVTGDAPAAALSRVISPGVFVQQETGDAALEAFLAFDGVAVAALLPASAVSFVHDPSAGTTAVERFVSITFPKEVKKRAIGGISATQQTEDYALLEILSTVPEPAGDTASDPAGKLSAWLLNQADLSA